MPKFEFSSYEPDPNPSPDFTEVYYVNSYPGAGKTHRALLIARETLIKGTDAGYVLVYAAPTERLIKQFKDALEKMLGVRRALIDRVKTVESGQVPVAVKLEGLLNSKDLGSSVIPKLDDGSVILCTHACISLVRSNMPGKQRVSLIFDEARQCVQREFSMKLPTKVIMDLHRSVVINESLPTMDLSRWSWDPASNHVLTHDSVRTLWPRVSEAILKRYMNLVSHIKNGALHVWVSMVDFDAREDEMRVNVILSPTRLFFGYGKVLILSAFFEHSQMYHLLRRHAIDFGTEAGKLRAAATDRRDRIVLSNVTDQLIDAERVKRIKEDRLSRALMTYVFEDVSLAKYHIQRGIVVPGEKRAKFKETSAQYQTLFEAEKSPLRRAEPYKQLLHAARSPDIVVKDTAMPRVELLESLEPLKLSVVQYMVAAASKLQRKWLKTNRMGHETLLICVNAKESSSSFRSLFEEERIDELLNKGTVGKDRRVEAAPVVSQGLNTWASYHTAAFLATVKLAPMTIRFLKSIISDYKPELDRTVDQCIQFIFRSSLRNADSNNECLLIVSDSELAQLVNETLGGPIKIVPPSKILKDWKPYAIATYSAVEARESKASRVRRYRKSANGKDSIDRYEQIRKADPIRKKQAVLNIQLIRVRKQLSENLSRAHRTELVNKEIALLAAREALKIERAQSSQVNKESRS
jgi:hypothetical protein